MCLCARAQVARGARGFADAVGESGVREWCEAVSVGESAVSVGESVAVRVFLEVFPMLPVGDAVCRRALWGLLTCLFVCIFTRCATLCLPSAFALLLARQTGSS